MRFDPILKKTFSNTNLTGLLFIATFLLIATPINAYAYLDPGTGGIIAQSVLAVIAGLIVALKTWRHKIAKFFGFGGKKPEKPHKDDDRSI